MILYYMKGSLIIKNYLKEYVKKNKYKFKIFKIKNLKF